MAAVLNIAIPLHLGHLINSVSQLEPGHDLRHYLTQLAPSAAKLVSLYVVQVSVLRTLTLLVV